MIVKKLLGILLFIFLTSCSESEESKSERYFANCVKDLMELKAVDESRAIGACVTYKAAAPDEFKYYEGRVHSKKK